jgi:succinoglycan biosynthesis protein ExoM
MSHFAVAICTAKRPNMLMSSLESVVALSLPSDKTLSIIVVENDLESRSRDVIEKIRQTTTIPMRYVLEPHVGIPFARNCALAAAIADGADWIAMLDDDERAEPNWLVQLHAACLKFDAEIATGPVRQIFDVAPPHWWKQPSRSRRSTGLLMSTAYTNNVLIRSRIIAANGLNLRFDEQLTFGAEDSDFFQKAHEKGARMVWVAEACLVEQVPSSRLTMRRSIDREHMVAVSTTFAKVIRNGRARTSIRYLPNIVRRLVVGTLYLVAGLIAWPVSRATGEKVMFKGAVRITKAWGSFCGLLGRTSNYYEVIDGA